ncbi:hypothetical protein [Paraburkholderia youngii]|uniref:hypothetical protein n=1 Tax=Paraburkholderia youngii TaxID=2782701 RepID=UPI003D242832
MAPPDPSPFLKRQFPVRDCVRIVIDRGKVHVLVHHPTKRDAERTVWRRINRQLRNELPLAA